MNASVTVFPKSAIETEKTGKTDSVDNNEFLHAVFGDNLKENRPIVVSFTGNPEKAANRLWFGQAWQAGRPQLPADANNYFSLAVFRPDDAGQYRRQKSCFHALHAVMLDDIGTKIDRERMTLAPSWLLETSLGNYQAGYLLKEPMTDGLSADRLMNAIIAAKLCDPGANGPRARLARLPVAINGKHTPAFSCRMMIWSPELRYSADELVSGLQLDMVETQRPKRQHSRESQGRPVDGDPVWLPRPDENPILCPASTILSGLTTITLAGFS